MPGSNIPIFWKHLPQSTLSTASDQGPRSHSYSSVGLFGRPNGGLESAARGQMESLARRVTGQERASRRVTSMCSGGGWQVTSLEPKSGELAEAGTLARSVVGLSE